MTNEPNSPNTKQLFGLLKFFKNQDHLRDLLDGKLYCNTPEYYRLSNEEGISDKNESAVHTYRKKRGDKNVRVIFGRYELEGLIDTTLQSGDLKDAWLHCWVSLELPNDVHQFALLAEDLNRIRKEFGTSYVYLPGGKIRPLIEIIKTITDKQVHSGMVKYSANTMLWNPVCKSIDYSYQREYRILVGQCDITSTQPLVPNYSPGFRHLLLKNHPFHLIEENSGRVCFHLSEDDCWSDC